MGSGGGIDAVFHAGSGRRDLLGQVEVAGGGGGATRGGEGKVYQEKVSDGSC